MNEYVDSECRSSDDAERRFQATFEQAAVGIAHVALDGSWLRVNKTVCDILGYSHEQLLQLNFQSITHPDDLDADVEQVHQMLAGVLSSYEMEKRYLRKDGSLVWANLTVGLVSTAAGEPEFFVSVLQDIQKRKEVEFALQEATAQLDELAEALPGAIHRFVRHADGTYSLLYMSEASKEIWGLSAEELMADSSPLWEMVLPEDRPGLQQSEDDSRAGLQFWRNEWRIRARDGQIKWLSAAGKPRRFANGDTVWNSVIIDVTAERQSLQALNSFFNQRLSMNLIFDLQGRIIKANDAWQDYLGYAPEELVGRNYDEFVYPEDRPKSDQERAAVVDSGISSLRFENRWYHKDGSVRRLSWSSRAVASEGVIYATAMDVTELHAAGEQLKLAATVFNSTAEGVVITGLDGTIEDVNQSFEEITGYSRGEVIGANPRILKSGRHDAAFYREIWRSLFDTGDWQGEIWNKSRDGRIYPGRLTISTSLDDQQRPCGYVGVLSDITEQKAQQVELHRLAHYDSLTDLANRALFREVLEQALKAAERRGSRLAVLFLDLDQFKGVNDSLGHAAGDDLLRAISGRLRRSVRDNDFIARISGDEFVLLLQDFESDLDLHHVLGRVMDVFAEPFEIKGSRLRVTASGGVSLYPDDAGDGELLMQYADLAMFESKSEGRNTLRFFSPELDADVLENAELGSALALALARSELSVHFQPQVELAGGRVVGLEALLRWQHPAKGSVPPDRFIAIAETRGLMMEIGGFVLEEACRQAAAWRAQGLEFGRIAVNVSGNQLQNESFLAEIEETLARTGLPAEYLELELTESVLMRRPDRALAVLEALVQRGVQIAIDDFGTGYSSLSYVAKLPVAKLKVDKQFIRDVLSERSDAALAASIVAMGSALDIDVVAEGVETEGQAAFLLSNGCRLAQGYLYCRPSSRDEIAAYLRKQARTN